MSAALPGPGDVLAGKFRVEAEIGRGGMGVVLRARDPQGRPCAIKVLLPEAIEHAETVSRFVNEAKAARELTSEHCVRIYEAGTLESGLPFMAMELLDGIDLESMLAKNGPMSVADACDAIIDASDALAEAHALGIVHRDVKPSNLFAVRGPDGRTRVKVLDFGVSKLAATARAAALTSTGTILGSPHYMAPEQLKSSKGVDRRADIWSLGVVLYELLTGKLPFDGKSFGHLFMQIVSEEPEPVTKHRADLPPGVVEIIERCLKKNRDERYGELAALVGSLARFASPKGAEAARRIAETRGAPAQPRDSRPSVKAFSGTLLMSNAPRSSGTFAPATPASQPAPSAPARPPAPGPAPAPPPVAAPVRRKKTSPAIAVVIVAGLALMVVVGMAIGVVLVRAR